MLGLFVSFSNRLWRRKICWPEWKPATYSALHKEAVTKRCRLDCHEIGLRFQNAIWPEVERLASLQPA